MSILQALTLDQIRLFITAADAGSFSAAGRRLHRAQSAVSYGVANLEKLLGLSLFDRSGHRPVLTDGGRGLLPDARQILDAVSELGARAASVAEGLEVDLRIAVDAICPAALLVRLGRAFQQRFPAVPLRIESDVLEAVAAKVLSGACAIGLSGPVGAEAPGLERRFLTHIAMVPVAAATHPLASAPSPIEAARARAEVQIVLSQRAASPDSADQGVLSTTTWRVADAATKLALIGAGLGWGNLPLDMVGGDLDRGALVHLVLEPWGPEPMRVPLSAITRTDTPPGPAGHWLLGELGTICQGPPDDAAAKRQRQRKRRRPRL